MWAGLLCCAGGFRVGASEPGPPPPKPLARLLAHVDKEPLAALEIPDIQPLSEALASSDLSGMILHERFAQGRAAFQQFIQARAGIGLERLWRTLRPNLSGPAALLLNRVPPKEPGGVPGFRLTLLLAVANSRAAAIVREAWPHLPPESGALLAGLRLRTVTTEALTQGKAPPVWARRHAKLKGHARVMVQPVALAAALQAWARAQAKDPKKAVPAYWMRTIRELAALEIERCALDFRLLAGRFAERLQLTLAGGARGTLSRLLRALRSDPQPWKRLMQALPARHNLSLLVQARLQRLGPDLTVGLQALERQLRGRAWTRRFGEAPESLAPERLKFIREAFTGTFGIVARPALSGEARLVAAFATPLRELRATRRALLDGLKDLDAPFRTLEQAERIGAQAPLAAQFKGRGFLKAPVIGLSKGWLWLCATPSSYHDLTAAFRSGHTLYADPAQQARARAAGKADPFAPPERSALRLRVNLERLAPTLYAAWWLSEDGPKIGAWKVPAEILPQPGVFSRRLGFLRTELTGEVKEKEAGKSFHGYAEGPLPGGSLLLLGLLAKAADAIHAIQQRQAMQRKLRQRILKASEPSSFMPSALPVSEPRPRAPSAAPPLAPSAHPAPQPHGPVEQGP